MFNSKTELNGMNDLAFARRAVYADVCSQRRTNYQDQGDKWGCILRRWAVTRPPFTAASLFAFLQLLGQVVGDAHLADGVQLAFEPVDVVLFVAENLFGQLA